MSLYKNIHLQCVDCKKEYPFAFLLRCNACQGLIDVVYDLDRATLIDSHKPLERYFYQVPLQSLASVVSLGEGNTPCIHARRLGAYLGLKQLFLKDETRNATGTTKDRMAACVLSQFQELGIHEFVASSTGNSSSSFAYGVQRLENMRLHLFCARQFLHRHAYCDHPRIQIHVIDGDFVDAGKAARQFAQEQELVYEGGFFNLARREGLKLAYLEAFDQMETEPAVIVQAVSSGMGIYGAYKGIQEYQRLGRIRNMPRIVCAQQDTCAPMCQAYINNRDFIRPTDIIHNPVGLAEAILRGDPSQSYPYLYRIVQESAGCFIAASQAQIREARQLLLHTEGLDVCYASATALASVQILVAKGWISPEETVLVNLTGGFRSLTSEEQP